ncbi:DUF4054 domain-containing protein [Arcobacter lanthieri]|uniref:DUF4054 domain-containing protein n=1 Tax=Aliarcobacter lanthieri TaxID=1355374 RepID=UPI00192469AE|nr:DUF4054 domain-containing protein [Aliarcobacter lanthieri]MBL3520300.1 DUF4054 domain-containing protein [Aliarcobacter lanthieri]
MAMIDDFKAKFPMIPTATVDTYFPLFQDNYKCYYGADYGVNPCDDEAILYLIAHLITVTNQTALTGASPNFAVASESVDGVSTSYFMGNGNTNLNDSFFLSTVYGQIFKQLISKNIGAFFV